MTVSLTSMVYIFINVGQVRLRCAFIDIWYLQREAQENLKEANVGAHIEHGPSRTTHCIEGLLVIWAQPVQPAHILMTFKHLQM